ncbi:hypothetical protein A2U01_0001561 [Trifolium medium]|uniref:Uncharacterized protein n=1 Tax=Trifolium medium TaxID=97028 RepID=A0A392M0E9_9FABA|nr:hypothetical protein [Trifolium medium]
MLHQKQNTYFGAYAKGAFQRALDYKKGVSLVPYDSIQARQTEGLEHVVSACLQQFETAWEVIAAICHDEDRFTAAPVAGIWPSVQQQQHDSLTTVQQQQCLT